MHAERGDYRVHVRVAYEPSGDRLRVTVPDSIRFPAQIVHGKLVDQQTLRLSPNPLDGEDFRVSFHTNERRPGSREFTVAEVRRLGAHFGMQKVRYSVEGSDLLLRLPEADARRPVKRYVNRRVGTPVLAPPLLRHDTPSKARPFIDAVIEEPAGEVVLSGHGSSWRYKDVSAEQLLHITAYINEYLHQNG